MAWEGKSCITMKYLPRGRIQDLSHFPSLATRFQVNLCTAVEGDELDDEWIFKFWNLGKFD